MFGYKSCKSMAFGLFSEVEKVDPLLLVNGCADSVWITIKEFLPVVGRSVNNLSVHASFV